jgi:3-phosphoshikimate 1-carboxyvinyltransferase
MQFKVLPGGALTGEVRVPGDKSISHRAIMLGALAEGTTQVNGFLEGEDALATLAAFRAMGVEIDGPRNGRVTVHGVGMRGLRAPREQLDLGNAGTGMRLLCGLLAGQHFDSELTGDASLRSRPMGRVIEPLTRMGASIRSADGGRPPLAIRGGQKLRGIHYDLPMASAQVKSCVLLAGLYGEGRTSVTEPAPTRDHTERMLRGFGYVVQDENGMISLQGGGSLQACDIDVPADISSAAFFLVAASIAPGSDLLLTHVGINPTRTGVLNILQLMGADITLHRQREVGGEPVADIRVRYAPLKGVVIPLEQVPLAIDEFPALFIAAACAEGRTVLHGAEELRVKESDRIAAMAEGLDTLGIDNKVLEDGIVIEGGAMGGGVIHTHHDHRIAMSFAIAGLRATGEITVLDCDHVATSFPGFDTLARGLGLRITALPE